MRRLATDPDRVDWFGVLTALPCRHARDCYGDLQVVFKDELTPEQLTQIEPDI